MYLIFIRCTKRKCYIFTSVAPISLIFSLFNFCVWVCVSPTSQAGKKTEIRFSLCLNWNLSFPFQICIKGKVHIFKYLGLEACRSEKMPNSLYLPVMEQLSLSQPTSGRSVTSPNHTALSVRGSCTNSPHCHPCERYWGEEGEQPADPPPEIVSRLQKRRASICLNGKTVDSDQGCVDLMVLTVWQLKRSFTHHIEEKWPQSNVTGSDW